MEEYNAIILFILLLLVVGIAIVGIQEQERNTIPEPIVSKAETPEWLKPYDQNKESIPEHHSQIGIRIPICSGNPNEEMTGGGALSTAGYGINLGGGLVYVP